MEKINILWLKKDLRSSDHQPLQEALLSLNKLLVVYCFEPFLSYSPDFDIKQWYFAFKSIEDLRQNNIDVHLFHDSFLNVILQLSKHFEISHIFAHQETGTFITYNRDREIRKYCKKNRITFQEYPHNGIWRGLNKKDNWKDNWKEKWTKNWHYYVKLDVIKNNISPEKILQLNEKLRCEIKNMSPGEIERKFFAETEYNSLILPGEKEALKKLELFLAENKNFNKKFIPGNGKYITLEISPYIAYGNLTIRQVFQAISSKLDSASSKEKINLEEIQNRLKWHCLTSQEFEIDNSIEFKSMKNSVISSQSNSGYLKAIKKAQTGYPFIDAILRCLFQTGHISFRQRSLLISFACHRLKLPWQDIAHFLARHFIDYNPAVHFTQCQMQAGTLQGVSLRIYDPIKQSKEKDPHGEFIKRWIIELESLPKEYIHEPWSLLSSYNDVAFKLGKNYPMPIDNHHKRLRVSAKNHKKVTLKRLKNI